MTDAGRPAVVPIRAPDARRPTDDQWTVLRARAEAAGIRFGVLLCEDEDSGVFCIPLNIESEIHREAIMYESFKLLSTEAAHDK